MKSEALWYLGERRIEYRTMDLEDPGPNEVLVQMEACGICGWDLLAYSGRFAKFHDYPFTAGHEGVGRIVRKGERVEGLELGQRVACHELPIGSRGGGLMARHALRATDKVSAIPEGSTIPLTRWVVEPVACVVNGLVYAGIKPGDSVALVGAGYMGLLMLQALRRTMAGRVSVFEPDARRLELARSFAAGMGGWDFQAPAVEPAPGAEPGKGRERVYDVVIETAGSAASLELAFALAKPYAIIENFAWHHHSQEFDLDQWHTKGWRILNIQPQMNPAFDALFPAAIKLMAAGAISNEGLVTHVASFAKAEEAYAAGLSRTGGYIKGVIEFE
ncbi:MAG TPA: alcohol dehydrogenase catalytic domain-containing protein [Rectinemataceae bacterium]|nr:alcohol dehydrogenase catalytic domain-containing protein [Rectinemataceae bacterium]